MQNYPNILIESQIFPPIRAIAYFLQNPNVCIEAHEHYQKRSHRNRYRIGSTQGPLDLSIPLLKGKNQQQNIQDVKISYGCNWPMQHLRAIQSSYGKSAYFIYYKDLIFELLLKKEDYLFDLNWNSLQLIAGIIPIDLNLHKSEHYLAKPDQAGLDLRNHFQFQTIDPVTLPSYYQVFAGKSGFISNLSILDLIFHQGPEAIYYLQQISKLSVSLDS